MRKAWGEWPDTAQRRKWKTHKLEKVEERRKAMLLVAEAKRVGVVSRNYDNGEVYEVVPWPTKGELSCRWPRGREWTGVELQERAAKKKRKTPFVPFYHGVDGDRLIGEPRRHRKRWSDAQWAAYHDTRLAPVSKQDVVATEIYIKQKAPLNPAPEFVDLLAKLSVKEEVRKEVKRQRRMQPKFVDTRTVAFGLFHDPWGWTLRLLLSAGTLEDKIRAARSATSVGGVAWIERMDQPARGIKLRRLLREGDE